MNSWGYTSLNFYYSQCYSGCTSCTGSNQNQCTSCGSPLNLLNGKCVQDCGPSYFANSNVCSNCYRSCYQCSGSLVNQCTQCNTDTFLMDTGTCELSCSVGQWGSITNWVCGTDCPTGQFNDLSTISSLRRCAYCDPTCAACSGRLNTQCTSCSSPKSLYIGQCIEACPAGTFQQDAAVCSNCAKAAVCSNCTTPCITCVTSATNCLLCIN